MDRVGGEVEHFDDLHAVDLGRRVVGVGVDEFFDLRRAGGSVHRERFATLEVDAEFGEDAVEKANEREVLGFRVGGGLGDEHGSRVAILVAHEVGGAVAVAFFAAEDIEARVLEAEVACCFLGERAVVLAEVRWDGGFVFPEFFTDVFEAGEGFDAAEAEFFRNGFLEVGGDERLDDHAARAVGGGEDAFLKKARGAIPREDRADLVAAEEFHFPLGVAGSDAHAVVIGIGGDDEVCAGAVRLRDRHGERLGVFGVGRFNGREPAIGNFLLGDGVALEAQSSEHRLDDHAADAVERGVDDLERVLAPDEVGVDRQGREARHVGFVNLGTHRNHPPALRLRNRREIFALDGVHLFNDRGGMGFGDLAAVLEVDLVAVVFGRVVAGSEVDARLGLHVAHGEGEFRSGARALEKVGVAAEVGDDFRGEFGEFAREKPRVVAEADGGFAGAALLGEMLLHIMHKPLGGAADVVGVHGVRASAGELRAAEGLGIALLGFCDHGADGFATEPTGAEREGPEKAVVQFGPIPFCDEFIDRDLVYLGRGAGEELGDVGGGFREEVSIVDSGLDRGGN